MNSRSAGVATGTWLELPYAAWKDTMETLHMELQIVGKVRLALSPFEPQWANVPLYLTVRASPPPRWRRATSSFRSTST